MSDSVTMSRETARRDDAAKGAKKNGKPKGPPEAKDTKFKRLAVKRVNNAVRKIGQLRALSNKSAYLYSDEQAAAIMTALDNAVNSVRTAFAGKRETEGSFKL